MRRLAAGFLLVLAGCTSSTGPPTPGLNEEYLQGLFTNFVPEYNYQQEETHLLGHVMRVEARGFYPWMVSLGFADSLGTREVTGTSVFRVGSATKVFTAVVILQLREEGLLELDTPFNEYLGLDTSIYPKVEQFSGVTIRHLLSHRSGIPRISDTSFFDVFDYTEPIQQMEKVRFLFTEGEPEFEPGSEYGYRNSNFTILGLVIEKVTGSPYHLALRERIHDRVGLGHTYLLDFDISPSDPLLAHGYTGTFDGTHYHGSHAWASGGLVSTARDLATFMRALVDGVLFQDPSTFGLMVAPEPGSPYGLGMFVTETPYGVAYGHGGAVFGYNTRMEHFPAVGATVVSTMSFNGYDFVVTNWYDDLCFPAIGEILRARG